MKVTLIIKPTKQCNASCRHCSADKSLHQRLGAGDVVTVVSNILKISARPVTDIEFIWHGGEPMLMGPDFYREVHNLLPKKFPALGFRYGMQSNLLAYGEEPGWKTVFSEVFNWRISTSYDFHSDLRRLSPSGTSAEYFFKWMANVRRFQDDSGGRVHSICVLSRMNFQRTIEMMDEANALGIDIKLNCLYPAGSALNMRNEMITPHEYGIALERSVIHWAKRYGMDNSIYSQGVDLLRVVRSGRGPRHEMRCQFNNACAGYFYGIEPDGSLYNCGECADQGIYPLGNALTGDCNMDNMLELRYAEVDIPPECLDCGICNGGCKKQRFIAYGHLKGKTPFCRAWKRLYGLAEKLLAARTVTDETGDI